MDSNFVMEKIFPYKDSILKIAQEEKNTYMKYLKEICSHDEKLTVVDMAHLVHWIRVALTRNQ